jgi:hypothetical protein
MSGVSIQILFRDSVFYAKIVKLGVPEFMQMYLEKLTCAIVSFQINLGVCCLTRISTEI